jgi:hypothetical protein
MYNHQIKFEVPRPKPSLIIDWKIYTYEVNWTLTLTFNPKINRGHLLVMNNHHTKFEVPRPKPPFFIDREPFYLQSQCDLDL